MKAATQHGAYFGGARRTTGWKVSLLPIAGYFASRADVRFGSLADIAPSIAMSAFPPKADIRSALADVR